MKEQNEIKFRLLVAFVAALLVMGVCFNVIAGDGNFYIRHQQNCARRMIKRAVEAMEKHKRKTGAFPHSFSDFQSEHAPVSEDGVIPDCWGRPLRLDVRRNNYVITSFGRDGKTGGVGLDCDLTNLDLYPRDSALPISQIVFHPLAQGMITAMLVCGVLTFLLTLQTVKLPRGGWKSWVGLGVQLAFTLAATMFVAMIVTILHIPTGH